MIENVEWLGHSTVKILGDKIIYIDPFQIKETFNDADLIFITHSHYDHYSEEDIKKCKTDKTKIIVTSDLNENALNLGFNEENIVTVLPNNNYNIDGLNFKTVASYNINKQFHPKTNNWVGYIISANNTTYYIAGDTDLTEEAKAVKCDIAFLPVGGTYTMTHNEASELANIVKPKIVVPIHYGSIVGTKEDAEKFKTELKDGIKCEIL